MGSLGLGGAYPNNPGPSPISTSAKSLFLGQVAYSQALGVLRWGHLRGPLFCLPHMAGPRPHQQEMTTLGRWRETHFQPPSGRFQASQPSPYTQFGDTGERNSADVLWTGGRMPDPPHSAHLGSYYFHQPGETSHLCTPLRSPSSAGKFTATSPSSARKDLAPAATSVLPGSPRPLPPCSHTTLLCS